MARLRRKDSFDPAFVYTTAAYLAERQLLLLVDVGGRPTGEQEALFGLCSHAILLIADHPDDPADYQRQLAAWEGMMARQNIPVIARLRSVLGGREELLAEEPVLQATLAGLERGRLVNGLVVERLAALLTALFRANGRDPTAHPVDLAPGGSITVVGAGVGAVLANTNRRRDEAALAAMEHEGNEANGRIFPNADDPVTPAPGTRPEYTPVSEHYKVFIRTEPTVIPAEGYALPVVGMVDNMLMLTLDDIRSQYESFDQYVTLSCISGRIGTSLISTTLWTGVSMQDILASAVVQEEAQYVHIRSGDGFYETVSIDMINDDERIMLCHSWDGRPLPTDHGFPLRIWIPDRYGMKQPKWITAMEITDEYTPGYWVERRWDEVARVNTTSVIDTVATEAIIENGSQRLVPIGGIAYTGARGISKVEVRMDGGEWQEAQLRAPLSETTWVIWRIDWPFAEGDHTFEVRCVDGTGAPQIEERRDARPSGSTGIHRVEASL